TKVLDKSLGSRHRAALGITEETDAVVVVVSEERGTISFCFNGNIISNLDGASLRQALLGLFGQRPTKKKGPLKRTSPAKPQTGSFRISHPPSSSTTGSIIVQPMEPSKDKGDKDPTSGRATPPAPRPMQPAPAIETPKPMPPIERPPSSDQKDS